MNEQQISTPTQAPALTEAEVNKLLAEGKAKESFQQAEADVEPKADTSNYN